VAGLLGGSAVLLGAFGSHGLRGMLESLGTMEVWKTANLYHLVHAVVLLWCASVQPDHGTGRIAAVAFLVGIILFSGSLYLLALTQWRWLGPVTPLGGVAFLVGWAALVFQGMKGKGRKGATDPR
jgi:uncharacterized membrane protein YgdD (TMEM256/DUF423 family)